MVIKDLDDSADLLTHSVVHTHGAGDTASAHAMDALDPPTRSAPRS